MDCVLHVVNLSTGTLLWVLEEYDIEQARLSADGRYLYVIYATQLRIVDTTSWETLSWSVACEWFSISQYGKYWYNQHETGVDMDGPGLVVEEWSNKMLGIEDNMFWGDLLEDNQTLALALYSQTVLLWDIVHQKVMGQLHLQGAWSPMGIVFTFGLWHNQAHTGKNQASQSTDWL